MTTEHSSKTMNKARPVLLSKGAHPTPFDNEGNATLCIQEYTSYLAGEPHSDSPKCVSRVLTAFMVPFNDALDHKPRQRLRPYAVRQIGTGGDGQDKARSYMAVDWLIRTYAPAFLDVAGLEHEARTLRGLTAIDSLEKLQAAEPKVFAARDAAEPAAGTPAGNAAAAAAAWDAAWHAARDAAVAAARAATWPAANAARNISGASARDVASTAWRSTVEALQASAFELLDKMCDPGGIHDITSEEEWLEQAGREALNFTAF